MTALPNWAIAEDAALYQSWRASVNDSAIATALSAHALDPFPESLRAKYGEQWDAELTKFFDKLLAEVWRREVDAIREIAETGENLGVCSTWLMYRAKAGAA